MQELSMDDYFVQLNQDIPLVNEGKEKILQAVNTYLQCSIPAGAANNTQTPEESAAIASERRRKLSDTLQIFDTPEGEKAVHYLSEMRRLWCILRVLSIEQEKGFPSFADGCENASALLEKYELTLYSLRRLHFRLSDASCADAIAYLQSNAISYLAIYFILHTEQLLSLPIWRILPQLLSNNWCPEDGQAFLSLLQA